MVAFIDSLVQHLASACEEGLERCRHSALLCLDPALKPRSSATRATAFTPSLQYARNSQEILYGPLLWRKTWVRGWETGSWHVPCVTSNSPRWQYGCPNSKADFACKTHGEFNTWLKVLLSLFSQGPGWGYSGG